MQIGRAAVQGGHQHLRWLPSGLCRGRGGAAAGWQGGGAGSAGALPVLRPVRQGGGVLYPLGVHQAGGGRHHPHRQARPAPSALQAPAQAVSILILFSDKRISVKGRRERRGPLPLRVYRPACSSMFSMRMPYPLEDSSQEFLVLRQKIFSNFRCIS